MVNILFLLDASMGYSGARWPVISEAVHERCLQRVTGRVRFIEGLTPQQQWQASMDAVNEHPEQLLLAYVFGKFREHVLIDVKTEAEKMVVLAALNLVECIAEGRPESAPARC